MGMKILIADDEYLERDVLEVFLKQYEASFDCIKVSNGRDAVSTAREYQPDICILDIQMPLLNGLECAKEIKDFLPNARILFITAWSSFDYAQQALRLGAADYLVKPVDYTVFSDRLDKLLASCGTPDAKQAVDGTVNAFSREFFASLKYGRLPVGSIVSTLSSFGIHAENGVALVASGISMEKFSELVSQTETLHGCPICYFSTPYRTTVLLFSAWEKDIVGSFSLSGCPGCRIGVGVEFTSLLEIPKAIHTASLCHTQAVHSSRQVCSFLSQVVTQTFDRATARNILGDLVRNILEGRAGSARQSLHELIDNIKNSVGDSEEGMKELYEIALVCRHAVQQKIPLFHRPKPDAGSMMEVENYLMDFIDDATQSVLQDRQDKYARQFGALKRYLAIHYMENPSQEQIAQSLGITGSYFSRLFKDYNGQTFSEYMTALKMERAKEMFRSGHNVQETSLATGFSDSNYMARVFRQYCGCSPSEFKERCILENQSPTPAI